MIAILSVQISLIVFLACATWFLPSDLQSSFQKTCAFCGKVEWAASRDIVYYDRYTDVPVCKDCYRVYASRFGGLDLLQMKIKSKSKYYLNF